MAVYRVDKVDERRATGSGRLRLREFLDELGVEDGDILYVRLERANGAGDQISISLTDDRHPTSANHLVG